MKGLLYIIPADPKAIRERCEITAPPTVEELRKIVGGYIGIVHGFTSIDIYGDGLAMPCVAFCNEDGKRLDLPVNWLATGLWHDALVRKGSRFGVLAEGGGYEDSLVGVIVVISGDSKLMDELFHQTTMTAPRRAGAWACFARCLAGSHGPAAHRQDQPEGDAEGCRGPSGRSRAEKRSTRPRRLRVPSIQSREDLGGEFADGRGNPQCLSSTVIAGLVPTCDD
jgi:hypothetical protein